MVSVPKAVAKQGNLIFLVNTEGSSNKFYELIVEGKKVTIRYGKIGTSGASTPKTFSTDAEAQKFADKTANEKRKKGYEDSEPDPDSAIGEISTGDLLADLEGGKKVRGME